MRKTKKKRPQHQFASCRLSMLYSAGIMSGLFNKAGNFEINGPNIKKDTKS
jgi:hypothetical protein